MKKLLVAIAVSLLLFSSAPSQTDAGKPTAGEQTGAAQTGDGERASKEAEIARLNALTVKLFNVAQYDKALEAAQRALILAQEVAGAESQMTVTIHKNIGEIYFEKRDFDEAVRSLERVLLIYEKLTGPASEKVAEVLERLGMSNYWRREYGKAEEQFQRMVGIREKLHGSMHIETAKAIERLADFYYYRVNFHKGAPLYERVLGIKATRLGYDHDEVDVAMDKYECLSINAKQEDRYTEFRKKWRKTYAPPASDDKRDNIKVKAIHLEKPGYPPAAIQAHVSGDVRIRVVIDETGQVVEAAELCKRTPYLGPAAIEAALKSRYSPKYVDGKPVKVTGIITYHFNPR